MQGYPRIVQRQDESLEKNVLRLLILYFEHKWFLVAFKFVNTLQVKYLVNILRTYSNKKSNFTYRSSEKKEINVVSLQTFSLRQFTRQLRHCHIKSVKMFPGLQCCLLCGCRVCPSE